jgi:hypothetical protein
MLARLRWYRERLSNRRALRAERRTHPKGDFTDAARKAEGKAWGKGGYYTK